MIGFLIGVLFIYTILLSLILFLQVRAVRMLKNQFLIISGGLYPNKIRKGIFEWYWNQLSISTSKGVITLL